MTGSIDAARRRLQGSANRIYWRSNDIAKVMAKFGLLSADAGSVGSVAAYKGDVSGIAMRQSPAPSADGAGRTFTFVISSNAVDRQGDVINQAGWQLGHYRRNPIVLWSHAAGLVPIGKATRVWVDGSGASAKLKATAQLAPADINPDAEQVCKMIEAGYLTATSVGFLPLKFKFSEDPGRKYGIDFEQAELLEFSIVGIPANPEALLDVGQRGKAASPDQERARARRQRELDLIRLKAGKAPSADADRRRRELELIKLRHRAR